MPHRKSLGADVWGILMLQASRRTSERKLAGLMHTLAVMAVVVLSMGTLGADCSPTPASCAGGVGPGGCANGLHRVCLNRCVSYVTSGACSLDPCNGNICAPNLACVPSSAGSLTGSCQAAASTLPCDPASTTVRCLEGTFCQRRGTQAEVDAHTACFLTLSAQGSSPGLCVTPAREGDHCDGDWNSAMAGSSLICSPCEPGTQCFGGICHRKCTVDGDCPCTTAGSGLGCRAALPGSGTRVCDICRGDGMNCQGNGRPNFTCCNSLSSCNPQNSTFQCCRGNGATATSAWRDSVV